MLIRNYSLRFATPAFLGNAEQSGQWRTPPIKALLRQWWRVAYAASLRAIATYVKAAMQQAQRWKERTEKKNPLKDHDHQHTLLVMKWLAGL